MKCWIIFNTILAVLYSLWQLLLVIRSTIPLQPVVPRAAVFLLPLRTYDGWNTGRKTTQNTSIRWAQDSPRFSFSDSPAHPRLSQSENRDTLIRNHRRLDTLTRRHPGNDIGRQKRWPVRLRAPGNYSRNGRMTAIWDSFPDEHRSNRLEPNPSPSAFHPGLFSCPGHIRSFGCKLIPETLRETTTNGMTTETETIRLRHSKKDAETGGVVTITSTPDRSP